MLRVAIIVGSTRPGRKGEAVARWVYEIAGSRGDAKFELVDIKDYDLPLLDESMSAISGKYSKDHTKAWSAKIDSFDAFVFVTPEYNHATSGALKNAIDYRFRRLRRRGRRPGRRKPSTRHGRADGRRRARASRGLALHRLRELQRLQAGAASGKGGSRRTRPGDRVGRGAEIAARAVRPRDGRALRIVGNRADAEEVVQRVDGEPDAPETNREPVDLRASR